MARLADGIVRYYEEFLGPYPFAELEIVEVPHFGFGIAPSGIVLLTTDAYKPHTSFLAAYFSRGVNSRAFRPVSSTTIVAVPSARNVRVRLPW